MCSRQVAREGRLSALMSADVITITAQILHGSQFWVSRTEDRQVLRRFLPARVCREVHRHANRGLQCRCQIAPRGNTHYSRSPGHGIGIDGYDIPDPRQTAIILLEEGMVVRRDAVLRTRVGCREDTLSFGETVPKFMTTTGDLMVLPECHCITMHRCNTVTKVRLSTDAGARARSNLRAIYADDPATMGRWNR